MRSKIIFGDEKLKKEFEKLEDSKEKELKEQLIRAFENIEQNAFCGIQIPKKLIPKEYKERFGELTNLWKYNLPDAWRLVYTVKNDKVSVLAIILEWIDHKGYERRFNY
ncbi:MAG: hypothetical protein NT076_01810 [Candidatus Pacearchaeota archaeon]|nr:hypothetical protein [Candidatus Pacearchaeota archaeon]